MHQDSDGTWKTFSEGVGEAASLTAFKKCLDKHLNLPGIEHNQ